MATSCDIRFSKKTRNFRSSSTSTSFCWPVPVNNMIPISLYFAQPRTPLLITRVCKVDLHGKLLTMCRMLVLATPSAELLYCQVAHFAFLAEKQTPRLKLGHSKHFLPGPCREHPTICEYEAVSTSQHSNQQAWVVFIIHTRYASHSSS